MREFRPHVRPSTLRTVLALLFPIIVIVPMTLVLYLLLGMKQPSYTIADGQLVIESGDVYSGAKTLKLADITEARVLGVSGGRRTNGTSVRGLCAGSYRYPELGRVWQATDCRSYVLLLRATTSPEPILISPPEPGDFAAAIGAGTPTHVLLAAPGKGVAVVLGLALAPIGIITAAVVSLLLLRGPGRMRYAVGDGRLEVRTLFGSKRWRTTGARAKMHTPTRVLRVMGTGAPGYYTGRFRESGASAFVYATDLSRVLLFEGPARVLLSPEDAEGMLRALEAEGVTVERHTP